MSPSSEHAPQVVDRVESERLRVCWAAERTHLAWIRTGVALMGFGFIVARFGMFLREMPVIQGVARNEHPVFSLWIGSALIGVGVFIHAASTVKYITFVRGIDSRKDRFPLWLSLGFLVSMVLAVMGVMMGSYLFVLDR